MENQNTKRTLLDEHLDFMIRLAYRREEERLLQKLAQDAQKELTPEEIAAMQRGYDLFLEKYEALEKQKRRAERILQMKKSFSQIGRIAAVFIILLAIAAPIAIAAIEPVRTKVLTLLLEMQEEYTTLSLIDKEENDFYVPEGWKGEYYLSYIPNDFKICSISKHVNFISFFSTQEKYIEFWELSTWMKSRLDTENTVMSIVAINGQTGYLFTKEEYCAVTWSIEDNYFIVLTDGMPSEECLRIARSVRKIPE